MPHVCGFALAHGRFCRESGHRNSRWIFVQSLTRIKQRPAVVGRPVRVAEHFSIIRGLQQNDDSLRDEGRSSAFHERLRQTQGKREIVDASSAQKQDASDISQEAAEQKSAHEQTGDAANPANMGSDSSDDSDATDLPDSYFRTGELPKEWSPPESSRPLWRPEGLLREAVALKKAEVEAAQTTLAERPDHPVNLRMTFYTAISDHRFSRVIRREDGALSVIAAMKRFQVDYGETKPRHIANLDNIAREARLLELSGVCAAMICTDKLRHGCENSEIAEVAKAVAKTSIERGIPLIRHDLIIDPIQIAEGAVAGAVAVNIVAAAALPDLPELLDAATAMGVECIVECHTELEREMALESGATILHFTNRDRSTNKIYPGRAEQLRLDVPSWVITIGSGGLVTAGDAWSLLDVGFDGVVLGETLLNSPRPERFIGEIQSRKRPLHNPFDVKF